MAKLIKQDGEKKVFVYDDGTTKPFKDDKKEVVKPVKKKLFSKPVKVEEED